MTVPSHSSLSSRIFSQLKFSGQGIVHIVTGGLVSVAGGGKFKNGAVTGAFAYTFGSIAQRNAVAADSSIDYDALDEFAANGGFSVGENALAVNWPSLPQGVVDFSAGLGDGISLGGTRYVRELFGIDGSINYDSITYQGSNLVDTFTPGLGTFAVIRGAAAGGTRIGNRLLNSNRYLRIGPGRMPPNGSLPAGPKVLRMSIGKGPGNPHVDLRVRPFD